MNKTTFKFEKPIKIKQEDKDDFFATAIDVRFTGAKSVRFVRSAISQITNLIITSGNEIKKLSEKSENIVKPLKKVEKDKKDAKKETEVKMTTVEDVGRLLKVLDKDNQILELSINALTEFGYLIDKNEKELKINDKIIDSFSYYTLDDVCEFLGSNFFCLRVVQILNHMS